MKRPRESASEWGRRIAMWRSSGESASVFAERHGWNPRTLTWWSSHLEGRARGRQRESSKTSFVEVVECRKVPAEVEASLDLIVPGAGTVRVSATTDLALLRAVVDALGGRK